MVQAAVSPLVCTLINGKRMICCIHINTPVVELHFYDIFLP